MKAIEKFEEKFILNYLNNQTNATPEELKEVLKEVQTVLKNSAHGTLEEVVEGLTIRTDEKIREMISEYPIPGYNIQIDSGDIKTAFYGGTMDDDKNPMKKDAIFDIASITKLFTQIITYKLIDEGFFDLDTKVMDVHPSFINAGDMTIRDLTTFGFSFNMDGRIEEANSVEEAKSILYTLGVNERKYAYTDPNTMALKEIAEKVTGLDYEDLIAEYVIKKINSNNIYLEVPEDERHLVTGTPNAHRGVNNDMKAIKMGNAGGNAGILTDSTALKEVLTNLYLNDNFFPKDKLSDVYTESDISRKEEMSRGIMGNACVLGGSFVPNLYSLNSSAYQGSTRTQANVGKLGNTLTTSTTFFNPASIKLSRAKELEERLNKKFVKEYEFNDQHYTQISSQMFIPIPFVRNVNQEIAKLSVQLAFINELKAAYEPNYEKEVKVELDSNNTRKK